MADEKITLPEDFDDRKLTYHDPCYIGRYNYIYDEPRRVLSVLNTNGVTEMRRHRNKSFCCGGGGGRAWVEGKNGKRVKQARDPKSTRLNSSHQNISYAVFFF